MKLPKESKSLWLTPKKRLSYPALRSSLSVDVAVIGGGITGLTTALLLKRSGLTVAVLEGEEVAGGVSGHTTAHLTEVFDRSYRRLIDDFGEDHARLAARSSRDSLDRIAAFVKEEAIDCGFEEVPAFRYSEDPDKWSELEEERAAAARLDVASSFAYEVPLPFETRGLRFDAQAQFHPRKYLLHLAQTIPGFGSHVFERSPVIEIQDGAPCRLLTEQGSVRARKVVVAMHTPFKSAFLQAKLASYRSYVVAFKLADGVEPPAGLFWDMDEPYHYTRGYRGGRGPLLIVGGEDRKTGSEEDTTPHFEALTEFASRRFKVTSVAHRWSAQVVEPHDGLPFIGKDIDAQHVYVATGYSGTGLTSGTLAAMINSDLILNRENRYSGLYDPGRLNLKASVVDLVKQGLSFPAQFVTGHLKPAVTDSLADVSRGEGKIVSVAGEKTAVYRDEHGLLHAVSAKCTHMGCVVRFNNAEKSWDCPCHGSRFDRDGKVLNGPAIEPLESRRSETIVRDETPAPASPEAVATR